MAGHRLTVVDAGWRVECTVDKHGYHLSVDGGERLSVVFDGSQIVRAGGGETGPPGSSAVVAQDLARTLALALRGIFSFHASAVGREGRALAFLGPSGAGKSTLAAGLAGQSAGGVGLLADDLLPVAADGARVTVHAADGRVGPASGVPASGDTREWELAVVYQLVAGGGSRVVSRPLDARRAVMALATNTVAARLFVGILLEKHFLFCSQVAESVPVRRLSYPWSGSGTAAVRRLVEEDLAAG